LFTLFKINHQVCKNTDGTCAPLKTEKRSKHQNKTVSVPTTNLTQSLVTLPNFLCYKESIPARTLYISQERLLGKKTFQWLMICNRTHWASPQSGVTLQGSAVWLWPLYLPGPANTQSSAFSSIHLTTAVLPYQIIPKTRAWNMTLIV